MHELWTGVLQRQVFADPPPAEYGEAYAEHLRTMVERHADELAAVIVEPVVQGAGGMRFHSPAYLRVLREACDAHDVLLVFDEIATGFGRTGALFAAEHAAVTPDVLCVGKALTGGYLTMAATLCTARVADGISRGEVPVLAHGPTFMGNPLAAAVACASIELLLGQDWLRGGQADRGGAAGRALGRLGPAAGDGRAGARRDRGRAAGPRRGHEGGHGGGRTRGRVAAAVPRSDLHDAAVRHGRRGRGADRAGGVRGGAGGMT